MLEVLETTQEIYNVLRVASSLKDVVEILATMALNLLQMAQTFAIVTPSVLRVSLRFDKFCVYNLHLDKRSSFSKTKHT